MTADQIARLAIALDEVRPPVRRRIEVPLTIRLDRLHEVFQAVMGWENYHLYEFRIGRDIAYGVPDPNGDFLGSSSRPANRTTLAQLVAQTCNKTFKYIYDFGDDWQHTVKLEAIAAPEPEAVYPRLLSAFEPPAEQREAILAIARRCNLDVGGIEYLIDDRDGKPYVYDINALSNFVADGPRVIGFDPFERLVDYLARRAWGEA
jgi:hypothetical protein